MQKNMNQPILVKSIINSVIIIAFLSILLYWNLKLISPMAMTFAFIMISWIALSPIMEKIHLKFQSSIEQQVNILEDFYLVKNSLIYCCLSIIIQQVSSIKTQIAEFKNKQNKKNSFILKILQFLFLLKYICFNLIIKTLFKKYINYQQFLNIMNIFTQDIYLIFLFTVVYVICIKLKIYSMVLAIITILVILDFIFRLLIDVLRMTNILYYIKKFLNCFGTNFNRSVISGLLITLCTLLILMLLTIILVCIIYDLQQLVQDIKFKFSEIQELIQKYEFFNLTKYINDNIFSNMEFNSILDYILRKLIHDENPENNEQMINELKFFSNKIIDQFQNKTYSQQSTTSILQDIYKNILEYPIEQHVDIQSVYTCNINKLSKFKNLNLPFQTILEQPAQIVIHIYCHFSEKQIFLVINYFQLYQLYQYVGNYQTFFENFWGNFALFFEFDNFNKKFNNYNLSLCLRIYQYFLLCYYLFLLSILFACIKNQFSKLIFILSKQLQESLNINKQIRIEFKAHIEQLIKNIQGVFGSILKISVYHWLITYLLFSIYDIKYCYIASSLSFQIYLVFLSIVPIINTVVICVPSSIIMIFVQQQTIKGISLIIIYYFLSSQATNNIYAKNGQAQVINIILFIVKFIKKQVMGYLAFDLKGIILGPLLICLTIFAIQMIKYLNQ